MNLNTPSYTLNSAQDPNSCVRLEAVDVIQPANQVHILKSICLTIAHGESVGIVGPSGSGKSTLLMTLTGLERPSTGHVFINNTNLANLSEDTLSRFRGRSIGIIFQSFLLIPTLNALDNVMVPLELAGNSEARSLALTALAHVGMSHRLTHYPAELSGGEQQRVAIARALAPKPSLLVCDEPTGNLDSATGAGIIELIFKQQSATQTTLIMVTHDQNLAQRCGRVLTMQDGKIVHDETNHDAPNEAVS